MASQNIKIEQQSVDAIWLNDGEPVFFQGVLRKETTSTGEDVFTFYPHLEPSAQELVDEAAAEKQAAAAQTPHLESSSIVTGEKLLVTLEDGSMLTMVVSDKIKLVLSRAEEELSTEETISKEEPSEEQLKRILLESIDINSQLETNKEPTLSEVMNNTALRLKFYRKHRADKRGFPRFVGRLPLRFQVLIPHPLNPPTIDSLALSSTDTLSTETYEEESVSEHNTEKERWHSPDPFVNISGGGMSFTTSDEVELGDRLLLEFSEQLSQFLDSQSPPHSCRAIASVVRKERISEHYYEVGLYFESLSIEAREALSALTLEMQSSLI